MKFKNTFAANARGKEYTIPQIICGLYAGGIKFHNLPEEAQKLVLARVRPDPPSLWNTSEEDVCDSQETA